MAATAYASFLLLCTACFNSMPRCSKDVPTWKHQMLGEGVLFSASFDPSARWSTFLDEWVSPRRAAGGEGRSAEALRWGEAHHGLHAHLVPWKKGWVVLGPDPLDTIGAGPLTTAPTERKSPPLFVLCRRIPGGLQEVGGLCTDPKCPEYLGAKKGTVAGLWGCLSMCSWGWAGWFFSFVDRLQDFSGL